MLRTIPIDNLKCSGCANRIDQKLSGLEGVKDITVDLDTSTVVVDLENDEKHLPDVLRALKRLGYTEAGTASALDAAKSYVSCMVGRLTDQKNN